MEWHILATVLLPHWAMLTLLQRLPLNIQNKALFNVMILLISIIITIVLIYHLRYVKKRAANYCLSDSEICICCVQD